MSEFDSHATKKSLRVDSETFLIDLILLFLGVGDIFCVYQYHKTHYMSYKDHPKVYDHNIVYKPVYQNPPKNHYNASF